jgi:hypothetical protein
MNRILLTRNDSAAVQHYAETTRKAVEGVASCLEPLFWAEREGRTGKAWGKTLERLFALWCEQSGIVTHERAAKAIRDTTPVTRPELRRTVKETLGFAGADVDGAVEDFVADVRAGASKPKSERALLRVLYREPVRALCLESAHVTLARAVLYRILEDQHLAQIRISSDALRTALAAATGRLIGASTTPAVTLLDDMRRDSEDFLPLLYGLRELDWWQVPTVRPSGHEQLFHQQLEPVEVALQNTLRLLDGYDFTAVDRDVWRDVYEHHLTPTDRQRLGSFYTPDSLVDLALDLAGWRSDGARAIHEETIADIACGSGAFLVQALRRRREAMEASTANRLGPDPEPAQLDQLMQGIVGFDIHPFATFLASMNLVFQVIDLYSSVRRRHPDYSLPLNIFTADSLEDRGLRVGQLALRAEIPDDIRIRHTEQEIARYRELRARRFDVVVGNPPWGGVLKGKLSPLFDPERRREYRDGSAFTSATGKYDIYVLFIERAVGWLRDGGRYGLVVPNTFRDKDFGSGIRAFLVAHALPDRIIDFGPFGNLFFRAMNTPSVIAGTRHAKASQMVAPVQIVRVERRSYAAPAGDAGARQQEVVDAAQAALAGVAPTGVTSFVETAAEVRSWGSHHWPLHPERALRTPLELAGDYSCGEIFEPKQGVTPGGDGVLQILQMVPDRARSLSLEQDLVRSCIKGTDITRWFQRQPPFVMLYPYVPDAASSRSGQEEGDTYQSAFVGPTDEDALKLSPRTPEEERIVESLDGSEARERLLTHRIAAGMCPYPNAARYLLSHYDVFASRRPKGRALSAHGREWYEYLWPRDVVHMLATPKIVTRRLTRWPDFALDETGVLPTDSCIALWRPGTTRGRARLRQFEQQLSAACGRTLTHRDALVYTLAFLNGSAAAFLLRVGREPTPKGSWTVDEEYLAKVRVAIPRDRDATNRLLDLALGCVEAAHGTAADPELERELDGLVLDALGLGADARARLEAWGRETRPGRS